MINCTDEVNRHKDEDFSKTLEKLVKKYKGQYLSNKNVFLYHTRGLGGMKRIDSIHMWVTNKPMNTPYVRLPLNEAKRLGFKNADLCLTITIWDMR